MRLRPGGPGRDCGNGEKAERVIERVQTGLRSRHSGSNADRAEPFVVYLGPSTAFGFRLTCSGWTGCLGCDRNVSAT